MPLNAQSLVFEIHKKDLQKGTFNKDLNKFVYYITVDQNELRMFQQMMRMVSVYEPADKSVKNSYSKTYDFVIANKFVNPENDNIVMYAMPTDDTCKRNAKLANVVLKLQ